MPDRADLAAAVLAILGLIAALVLITFVPGSVNGDLPNPALFFVLTVPIFSYAAYWAFSIRKALAVPLYRRQAFGIGVIVVALWSTVATFVLIPSTAPFVLSLGATNFSFYFLFIVLFYWIDASVLASRRSDPLLRDTLYWSKIRIPFWIINIIIWSVPLAVISYGIVVGDNTLLNEINQGTLPDAAIDQVFNAVYTLSVLVLIAGIIYLPAIAIRAKWNAPLRKHFIWFAPTAVGLLLMFFVLSNTSDPASNILHAVVFIVVGYTLYKSAKALVPVNKISLSQID